MLLISSIFEKPFQINDEQIYVTSSMGITMYPQDAGSFDDLINCAFSALKRAKKSGARKYEFYQSGMAEHATLRMRLEHELKQVIDNHEIIFHYQPKIDIYDGRLTGFESLARWIHKDKDRSVPPSKFIPVLEETGLIFEFGRQAIEDACRTLSQHITALSPDSRIAINLSSKQFFDQRLTDHIKHCLQEYNVSANLLEFEVTESLLIHNINDVKRILGNLNKMGCHISLDDFGTGYSSLRYLKSLPVDTIKIDRSFVSDIHINSGDRSLVETIITLSHNLDKRVVAEGVENNEQIELLREMSCDEIQGYYINKPLPLEELGEWVTSTLNAQSGNDKATARIHYLKRPKE